MKAKKRKSENGNGTLRQRANGKFEYRISYIDVDGAKSESLFTPTAI